MRFEIGLPEAGRVERRDPVRAVRQVEARAEEVVAVARDLREDLAEAERHDREVVAAQAQRRQADDDPEDRRDDAAEQEQEPDRRRGSRPNRAGARRRRSRSAASARAPARSPFDADPFLRALLAGELLRGEPGGGVGAGRVERDVPEVEQARVADDDVQADGHHDEHEHVDARRDVRPRAEDGQREQVRDVERVHDRGEHGGDGEQARSPAAAARDRPSNTARRMQHERPRRGRDRREEREQDDQASESRRHGTASAAAA